MWQMMPQLAVWAIPKAPMIRGAYLTKAKPLDRPIKMEPCPQMNPGTTHCDEISPLAMQ